MHKHTTFLLTIGLLFTLNGCAELKDVGRTIGHTTRDTTKAIGHASRDAMNSVKDDLESN
uniref:Uncharacterized protein n=1 Tax=Aliivibrio wodanis TaxID=80852 RepID=A0A5Q4ZUL5_9GAMM|nr:hypothetical protein AW0309160_02998 [Aliivibrio wodanis]